MVDISDLLHGPLCLAVGLLAMLRKHDQHARVERPRARCLHDNAGGGSAEAPFGVASPSQRVCNKPQRHSGTWRSPAWPPPPAVQSARPLRPAWGGSSSAPLTPGVFKEQWPRGLQTLEPLHVEAGRGGFPEQPPHGVERRLSLCRAPASTGRTGRSAEGEAKGRILSLP